MLAGLLLASFLVLLVVVYASPLSEDDYQADLRRAFLITWLIIVTLVVLSSEVLSLFTALNQASLAAFWSMVLVITALLGWRGGYFPRGISQLKQGWGEVSWKSAASLFLLAIGLYMLVLFVVAWVAPPNTNDSLTYHMSRVMNWIQDRSLEHYPAHNDRQLYMPIAAELVMMQLHLLAGSDRIVNLVQWLSMLFSLAGVALIAKRLGAGRDGQVLSVVFCVTIPMGIMQASSTQTDYVTASMLVSLAYFSISAYTSRLKTTEWLWLCLAFALGLLAKGDFIAFSLPFLIGLLGVTLRKSGWRQALQYALLGILVVLILNLGSWSRNQRTYAFPLGPRQAVTYHTNEAFGVGVLISNVMRNTTLHLGTPYGIVNGTLKGVVERLDHLIGQDPEDPRTSLGPYRVKRSQNEDYASNPLHLLLIIASLVLIAWRSSKPNLNGELKLALIYAAMLTAGFLLFSGIYKWQAWGSRLQLPLFVAWSPVIGAALHGDHLTKPRNILGVVLLLSGLPSLLSNPSRPIIPGADGSSVFRTSRQSLLFINSPEFEQGYLSITAAVRETGCRDVGLKIDSSHPDYPFWVLLSPDGRQTRLVNIDPQPALSRYVPVDFRPCAIICTICSQSSLQGLELASSHYGGYLLYLPPPVNP